MTNKEKSRIAITDNELTPVLKTIKIFDKTINGKKVIDKIERLRILKLLYVANKEKYEYYKKYLLKELAEEEENIIDNVYLKTKLK